MGLRPRINSIVRSMLLVEYMVESTDAASRVGADDEGDGAVGVHVVGAILRIVFHDENRGLRPELRMADGFDNLAQREIVVRDIRRGRAFPSLAPWVWSLGRRTICSRGISPSASKRLSSEIKRSARFTSG